MKTISAVFQDGRLKRDEPLDLPENTRLRIALLDQDDLPSDAMAKLAQSKGAFDFLNDPREDIYSQSDGEPL